MKFIMVTDTQGRDHAIPTERVVEVYEIAGVRRIVLGFTAPADPGAIEPLEATVDTTAEFDAILRGLGGEVQAI